MVIIIFVNAFYNYDEYRGNGEGKKEEEEKKSDDNCITFYHH